MHVRHLEGQAADAHEQAGAAQAQAVVTARDAATVAREQARTQAQMMRDQAQMMRDAVRAQRDVMTPIISIPSSHGPSPRQEKMMFSGFVIVVMAAVVIFYPLVRAFARRLEGGSRTTNALDAGSAERLQRIEHTVDAMAIEIERISEGQRFTTRLLSSRVETPASLDR